MEDGDARISLYVWGQPPTQYPRFFQVSIYLIHFVSDENSASICTGSSTFVNASDEPLLPGLVAQGCLQRRHRFDAPALLPCDYMLPDSRQR